jgi:hypothetical protein
MKDTKSINQDSQPQMQIQIDDQNRNQNSIMSAGTSPVNNRTSGYNGTSPVNGRNSPVNGRSSPLNSPVANRGLPMKSPPLRMESYNYNTSAESLYDKARMRDSTMMGGESVFPDGLRGSVMMSDQAVFPDGLRESVMMSGQAPFADSDGPDPRKSFAEMTKTDTRTNLGNTKLVMNLLSEMWLLHIIVILGCTYAMTFVYQQGYTDEEMWNYTCWWKLGILTIIIIRLDFPPSIYSHLFHFFDSSL